MGNTRGQILEVPIEMAGHLYNKAGATAQPVIATAIQANIKVVRNRAGSTNAVIEFTHIKYRRNILNI